MSFLKISEKIVLNKLKKIKNGNLKLINYDGKVFHFGSLESNLSADIKVGSINNFMDLDIKLRIAELQNLTKSIQNSTMTVLNNKKAKITAGTVDYHRVREGTEVVLKEITYLLNVDVTPQITLDGDIHLTVHVKSEEPTGAASDVVSKTRREIETVMLRKSGETAVMGGVNTALERTTYEGIPFLQGSFCAFRDPPGAPSTANTDAGSSRKLKKKTLQLSEMIRIR